MKVNSKYSGTYIGGIFTVVSMLFTLTLFVPVISVFLGAVVESIGSNLINEMSASIIGKFTIITLIAILIVSLTITLFIARKNGMNDWSIIRIMIFQYFVIHGLGLYIHWATSYDYRNDGQMIFIAIESHPISSIGFLVIGVLIDLFKKKT